MRALQNELKSGNVSSVSTAIGTMHNQSLADTNISLIAPPNDTSIASDGIGDASFIGGISKNPLF